MAPWSSWTTPPNSHSSNPSGPGPATSNAVLPPTRPPPRVTESDILDNAYGIPTLPPPVPRNLRSGGHGRSLSHPFTLFNSKKKRHGDNTNGLESTEDDDDSLGSATRVRQPVHISTGKQQVKIPDKDLLTGKCMTCDSMVRWPRNLNVFRCTVCMTINDLKPILLEARHGDGHRVVVPAGRYGSAPPQRVAPISLENTRKIIEQCITAYLLNRLKHEDVDATGSPSHSPALKAKAIAPLNALENMGLEDPIIRAPDTPMHFSEYPASLASPGDRGPLGMSSSRAASYSMSTPEDCFGSHMEFQSGSPYSSQAGGSGSKPHQEENLDSCRAFAKEDDDRMRRNATKSIFKPVEDYIIAAFGSYESINNSFSTARPSAAPRTASEGNRRSPTPRSKDWSSPIEEPLSGLDAKTLLLGDFAENGSWWTGNRESRSPERVRTRLSSEGLVTLKSPQVDWNGLNEWYYTVIHTGRSWQRRLDDLNVSEPHMSQLRRPSDYEFKDIDNQIHEAQVHTQRILLKATESLLKRPGRPLREPEDLRFLLIILANPLLYPSSNPLGSEDWSKGRSKSGDGKTTQRGLNVPTRDSRPPESPNTNKGTSGQHSGIIKRILGLLSNVPNECHHHLVSWLARFSDGHFHRTADLIGSFVTYRLTRQHGKRREVVQDPTAGLVPSMGISGRSTSAALHAALGVTAQPAKKSDGKPQPVIYNDDWQIKAAARVMALVFAANNSGLSKRGDTRPLAAPEISHSAGLAARERAHNHGQILPTSDFYNTLLDYSDLVADFEAWEARRGKFAFCQYPFFLSIWAKIQIMEHDARRQMEVKAREAFFDSIMTHKTVNQYLVLKIRRDCLVEDSLKGVSEVVGSGSEEIKKGLRIEFRGEEGIDAGGLRKEWFLLLVRDVFNPEHGMFTYDEDSQFCYFNSNSFETTDQFFLVGVVLGLAIYNSTILDVAFPPFAFRKLLAAGPTPAPGATSHAKPSMTYSLEDLAEFRPSLASGLRQLLDFEGDVENTFCRDFVAEVDRYGQKVQIPLCPDGEKKPVTNANRREFVDLYVRYLLDTSVTRQFEPFKRGFFTVCGGNALSLFRPEEIELLIRGSDEPLDIASLRAVSTCENWVIPNPAETEPVIQWFWQSFQSASPKDQRKLLSFITGSDRIPAMGTANLVIKLSCLGDDSQRFPVARTCFNMISLYRYAYKEKLESKLWMAVNESEGFGLK